MAILLFWHSHQFVGLKGIGFMFLIIVSLYSLRLKLYFSWCSCKIRCRPIMLWRTTDAARPVLPGEISWIFKERRGPESAWNWLQSQWENGWSLGRSVDMMPFQWGTAFFGLQRMKGLRGADLYDHPRWNQCLWGTNFLVLRGSSCRN